MELRVVPHDPEEKGRQEIGAAQGATRMSALCSVYHSDDVSTHLYGDVC